MKTAKFKRCLSAILLILVLVLSGLYKFRPELFSFLNDFTIVQDGHDISSGENDIHVIQPDTDLIEISSAFPAYAGNAYVPVNNNVPDFPDSDKTGDSVFEYYSDLDSLGRCGVAYANICQELMPTEKRESISSVKPSGWNNKKYDADLIDGGWLFNRCHLIGFQLAGENANEKNLITGTRYLNIEGMLPFENLVADYVHETDNHVLYRVTPVYTESNLVPDGVQLEGWSIEDNGEGVCFNIYAYNVQPGIEIDYATGESWLSE